MGNAQISGGQETPPHGYSCLNRFPSTRPLQFSSGTGLNFSNSSGRPRFAAAAGDGSITSSAMCCQPFGQQMDTFKNRDEALTKARYYRERNFELAIHAYSAALDFAPPVFRRSPPPRADDEQVLYIQLLDPTGFRGNSKEDSDTLVESIGRHKGGRLCVGDEVATGAACKGGSWSDQASSSLGLGMPDLYTSTSDDGRRNGKFRESHNSSSSTAFGSSGAVSRMESEDFCELRQGGVDEITQESTRTCKTAGSEVCGREEQQKAGENIQSNNSNAPPTTSRQENEALAAHHALTAEICDEVAQLYLAAGYKEEALRYFDRAVRLAPHAVEFLYRRGVVLQLIGEEAAAIDSFRKALELDPAYKAALFNLGTCLMRSDSGRKEALQLFHQLTELDPTNDQVLSLMAHCYETDGRYEEALAYRQKAVQLDPQNFRANRELSQLKQQLIAMGARRRTAEPEPAESELVALNGQRHMVAKVA